jgi:uncharacterized protein (TIGR02145 family)
MVEIYFYITVILKHIYLITLLFLISVASFAQTATEFWFVAPEVSKNGSQNFDIPIYFRITTFNDPAAVTITEPANPAFNPIVVNIPANGFSTVDLSAFLDVVENKPANTILNWGLHIVSTSPVSIYYEVASTYCLCNPELYTLKGQNALGRDFLIPTQNYFSNSGGYSPTPYNAFDIIATEDNTSVTITPSKDIVGHIQKIPFVLVLNRGQTWSGVATSQAAANHLFGSSVTSDKPIAITSSDDLLYGITGCADLIGDQIVPVGITGNEYVAIKGNLTNNGNRAFILATQDNTDIYVDGNAVPAATLNTGELYDDNIVNPSTYINSTRPVYVFQTSGFGCELGGALLPPIQCTGSTKVAFTRTTNQNLGVLLTTQNGNQGNFLLNGDPTFITAGSFLPVPGTGGNWVAASLTFTIAQIPVGTIVVVTNTTGTFHLGLMIGNAGGGCSYGYFSDFSRLNLGPDQMICQGGSQVLDAGSGWNSYLWNTGATSQGITVTVPGNYIVTVTDPSCTLSDTVVVSQFAPPTPALGPDFGLCQGLTDTLLVSGGPFPAYLWNTGETTSSIIISNTGGYSVTVTDANGCTASDNIQVSISPGPLITTNPLSGSMCTGSMTNIQLTSDQPGTTFSWTATGSSVLISGYAAGSGSFINQVLTNSGSNPETVTYAITPSNANCQGTPADFVVTVMPALPVSVSISASANNVCAGTLVSFLAAPVNPGTNPLYQWKVNGINSGNSLTFSYVPVNGDVVTCMLTSSESCVSNNPAVSNQQIMVINSNLPVSVSITASLNPFCEATPVTFTAAPVNGGSNPSCQWKVNGINSGTNSLSFIYTPVNGDIVSCVVTSTESCITNNPASSNQVVMTVNTNFPAGVAVTASANPFCESSSVSFSAIPVNGGPSPTFQWTVNALNVGTNSNGYTYSPNGGDIVRCLLTSNLYCVYGSPVLSEPIVMAVKPKPVVTFTLCNDSITTTNAKPVRLRGGIPAGGTYSGPGVSNGIFYPALAGVGTKTITYLYTNAALCSATAALQFVIHNPSFVNCGSNLTDIRDNKVYPTVQIGSQCWMAANLDYGYTIDESTYQRDNCVPEKYSRNLSSVIRNSFYQWDEMMNYGISLGNQGFCPPGWHVPDENDWNSLFSNFISNGFAGSPLLYTGYSGFNALLSGARHFNRGWDFQGFAAFFWSSAVSGTSQAWAHGMNNVDPSVSLYPSFRNNAFSVRCLKD